MLKVNKRFAYLAIKVSIKPESLLGTYTGFILLAALNVSLEKPGLFGTSNVIVNVTVKRCY